MMKNAVVTITLLFLISSCSNEINSHEDIVTIQDSKITMTYQALRYLQLAASFGNTQVIINGNKFTIHSTSIQPDANQRKDRPTIILHKRSYKELENWLYGLNRNSYIFIWQSERAPLDKFYKIIELLEESELKYVISLINHDEFTGITLEAYLEPKLNGSE